MRTAKKTIEEIVEAGKAMMADPAIFLQTLALTIYDDVDFEELSVDEAITLLNSISDALKSNFLDIINPDIAQSVAYVLTDPDCEGDDDEFKETLDADDFEVYSGLTLAVMTAGEPVVQTSIEVPEMTIYFVSFSDFIKKSLPNLEDITFGVFDEDELKTHPHVDLSTFASMLQSMARCNQRFYIPEDNKIIDTCDFYDNILIDVDWVTTDDDDENARRHVELAENIEDALAERLYMVDVNDYNDIVKEEEGDE